ncbi:uncharacterized protein [Miscanthus floridulus]|uniref:uncharacterized protein n=1 Tax=Miscanthus floridulus TaxID=154761 RepID=UPI003458A9F7
MPEPDPASPPPYLDPLWPDLDPPWPDLDPPWLDLDPSWPDLDPSSEKDGNFLARYCWASSPEKDVLRMEGREGRFLAPDLVGHHLLRWILPSVIGPPLPRSSCRPTSPTPTPKERRRLARAASTTASPWEELRRGAGEGGA